MEIKSHSCQYTSNHTYTINYNRS